MTVALDKKALWRDIDRDDRKARRAKLVALRAELKDARSKRRAALADAKARCKRERLAVRERARKLRAELAATKAARASARGSCAAGIAGARGLGANVARAKTALEVEERDQRALRRIAAGNRARAKETPRASARERQGESDDEVRANLPPDLVPLFNRVRRGIKGSARKSRTEAFLEYAEEHPAEVLGVLDDKTDALIAELEARQRAMADEPAYANPRKSAKRKPRRKNGSRAPSYRETHGGEVGDFATKRMRVPDPRAGELVLLGRVRKIEYETDKGEGVAVYHHAFGRPVENGDELENARPRDERKPLLVYNRDGLFFAGGDYRVKPEGIVG